VILRDKAASADVSALDNRIGLLKALGFPIDLGGFPGAQFALGILDAFAFDAIWTDFDPNQCEETDLRRLSVEVAIRRGLAAYRLREPMA
jgi:hypothetical protein